MAFAFPSSSPSDGATFEHAGFQYVWRGDRWDSDGFVGFPDPYADYTEATFTTTSAVLTSLDDADDYKETDWWPFRAGSFTQGTPQTDAELTALWPNVNTGGMWYVSDHTCIAVAGGNCRTAIDNAATGWRADSSKAYAGFDNDLNQITANSGQAPSFQDGINPGTFTALSGFGTATGVGIVRDDLNNSTRSIPATGRTWNEVTRLVAVAQDNSTNDFSLEMFRGPTVLHSHAYTATGRTPSSGTARYYSCYWRFVSGNLITTYNA